MSCNHPNEALVGTADGIFCSVCGAKIELAEEKPAKKAEPKVEPEETPAAEEKPKKAAPKRGGKK